MDICDRQELQELLKALSKRGGVSVLCAVNKSKIFNEIVEISGYDRGTVYRRLEEFVKLGLVLKKYDLESKLLNYIITPTGKRILELLEEIERVYKERVSLEEKELKWIEEALKKKNGS